MPPDLSTDLDRQIELQDLRAIVLSGQRLPATRYRQLIDAIREDRDNAARLARNSKAKAKRSLDGGTSSRKTKEPIDLATLF